MTEYFLNPFGGSDGNTGTAASVAWQTIDTSVQALGFPTANYNGLSVRNYLDIGALQRQEATTTSGLTGATGSGRWSKWRSM